MSDLVGISSGAVQAYQRALGVVSNNIANVGTEGYSRQVSDLATSAPKRVGQAYLGTGVEFQAVRRAVDDFVQQNLRNSNSDLANQKPLVDYANRVVDIMGSEDSGLTTAIDNFFAAARELSSDPASSVLRGAFLRESEGLAARFNEVDTQLGAIRSETVQYMRSAVGELNSLADELVALNNQLAKRSTEASQPATLLDQRDLLLQKMSAYAKLTTDFSQNGEVSVSLSGSMTKGILVDGRIANTLAVIANPQDPTRHELLLDPYGDKEPVAGISSGELGGLLAFSEQVLNPAIDGIDYLATVLVREVNAIHTDGLDGYGDKGGDLFGFDETGLAGAATLRVALSDPRRIATAEMFRAIEAPTNPSNVRVDWTFAEPPDSSHEPPLLSQVLTSDQSSSLSVSVEYGKNLSAIATIAQGTEGVVIYLDDAQPGQQLQLITSDGVHLLGAELSLEEQAELAFASPPIVDADAVYTTNYLNKTGVQSFKGRDLFIGAKASPTTVENYTAEGNLVGNRVLDAALVGAAIASSKSGTVVADGQVTFNHVSMGALTVATGEELQASDIATWLEQAIVRPLGSGEGGLVIAAEDIDLTQELNVTGYQGATAGVQPPSGGHDDLDALVTAINVYSDVTRVTASLNADGDLSLDMQSGYTTATVEAVANAAGVPGVTVTARTDVVIAEDDIDLTKSLSLYGRSAGAASQLDLTPTGGEWASVKELALAIEAGAAQTGVTAYINADGALVITNASGQEGEDIYIGFPSGEADNAIGVSAGWAKGHIEMTRDSDSAIDGLEDAADVRIGLGEGGSPWLLQQLGLRVGAYLGSQAPADIKVLVSGEGDPSLSASYVDGESTVKEMLRREPFEVRFTAIDQYDVIDSNSGTVVGKRRFDPHALPAEVTFMGMTLKFSSPPMVGDRFLIDGNEDGVGDNRAMLALVELQDKPIMPGEMTLTDAYINQVSQIGNISRQAKVAQEALSVVYEQAIEAREQVSGVSLDEEAADLIRFQQAYQASAKVMQTASTLFDAILTVG
jgi:flagellar hook-associated protein FlgK